MTRTYPCQVYELTVNYNVRKVTLARPYRDGSDNWGAYTKAGKFYRSADIFDTKAAAIKAGRKKIARCLKNIAYAQNLLSKHIDTLNKIEKEEK